MSTERSEERGWGGGLYGKIAWRSDLVKSQDAELHHGNAGNPQTAEGGRRGGQGRRNDQFDIKTPAPEKQQQKKRRGRGWKKKTQKQKASDQQQEEKTLGREEGKRKPTSSSKSSQQTLPVHHYVRRGLRRGGAGRRWEGGRG